LEQASAKANQTKESVEEVKAQFSEVNDESAEVLANAKKIDYRLLYEDYVNDNHNLIEAQIKNLEANLTKTQGEYDKQKSAFADLNKELLSFADEESKATSAITDLIYQKQIKDTELKALNSKTASVNAAKDKLAVELVKEKAALDELKASLAPLQEEQKAANDKIKEEEQEFLTFGTRRVEQQKKMTNLQAQISLLEDQLDNLITSRADLRTRFNLLKSTVPGLIRNYRNALTYRNDTNNAIESLLSKLYGSCDMELSAMEKVIASQQKSMDTCTADLSTLKTQLQKANEQIQKAKEQTHEQAETIKSLTQKLTALSANPGKVNPS
jgi:chromosome segregation ATPase